MADTSMTSMGSATPEASPTLARGRHSRKENLYDDLSIVPSGSPLRRLTYKTRNRDRSRERERFIGGRRGMSRPAGDEGESGDDAVRVQRFMYYVSWN
jgi:hypothetical protein